MVYGVGYLVGKIKLEFVTGHELAVTSIGDTMYVFR